MKIRQGFVSNSSSSSFLMYGFKFLIDDFNDNEIEDFDDLSRKFEFEFEINHDKIIFIGINIFSTYNEEVKEIGELNLKQYENKLREFNDEFDKCGFQTIKRIDYKPKLYLIST